jgi:ubiquinone/menaquinone biosynthesis C-methylase UbiE
MGQLVSFDHIADRYDATRHYPPAIAELIATELIRLGGVPASGTVVELGIGTGRISLPLLAAGVNVRGVDIGARMLERLHAKYDALRAADPARAWGQLNTELAEVTALPFPDASCDAVVCVHVLHLVAEWRRALDEALRVLRPAGAFLLGQDTRLTSDLQWRMQGEWMRIVRELGHEPPAYQGAVYEMVVAELRGRGLTVEEHLLATWDIEQTPRETLAWVCERLWSRTWLVPDDLFAESTRRLRQWAEREFRGRLDTPRRSSASFKLAVARREDATGQ